MVRIDCIEINCIQDLERRLPVMPARACPTFRCNLLDLNPFAGLSTNQNKSLERDYPCENRRYQLDRMTEDFIDFPERLIRCYI